MAGSKLKAFLFQLAKDPSEWAKFEEDPKSAMAAAGLSKTDQTALLSRNPEKIRKAVGAGARAICLIIIPFRSK